MNMEKLSRRELNKIQCRQRILKASRQLFSTKGYEETTMEDVADRAEVSKATLYNYFPGKDSLLLGIAEAELGQICQLIEGELSQVPSALERLRQVLEAFVLDSMCYISLSRKITYLNSCEDSDLFATRLEMVQILRGLVLQAQQQGELRRDVGTDAVTELVMGLYLTAQFQWVHLEEHPADFWAEKLERSFYQVLACALPGARREGPPS